MSDWFLFYNLDSARDVKDLYKRFRKLDRNNVGYITSADMQLIPELSMNPLCERIIALFDDDGKDHINFRTFVTTLHIFHPKTSREDKMKCKITLVVLRCITAAKLLTHFLFPCVDAFRCYDVDRDGKISESDLYYVLRLLVGDNVEEDQLRDIVKKTLSSVTDTDEAVALTFNNFAKVRIWTLRQDEYMTVWTSMC